MRTPKDKVDPEALPSILALGRMVRVHGTHCFSINDKTGQIIDLYSGGYVVRFGGFKDPFYVEPSEIEFLDDADANADANRPVAACITRPMASEMGTS
jgi:hypothetical protein